MALKQLTKKYVDKCLGDSLIYRLDYGNSNIMLCKMAYIKEECEIWVRFFFN